GSHGRMPGDIAGRVSQAGNEPGSERIGYRRHDDGDSGSSALQGACPNRRVGDDHIDFAPHEVGSHLRYATVVTVGPAPLDDHITSLGITGLLEALSKRLRLLAYGRPCRKQESDVPWRCLLLRVASRRQT